MLSGDSAETVELEDHVQTAVTAIMHGSLTLICRPDEHAGDEKVTWYRDRSVSVCVLPY